MKQEGPIILFDGVCNFCNSTVNFILRQDKKGVFRFAPLQSEAGQYLLQQYNLIEPGFDSFIFIESGKAYKASTAALQLTRYLPWYWQWAQLFWVIPSFIRDAAYQVIAKNRYKWFGKRDACIIPTPELRHRFLN